MQQTSKPLSSVLLLVVLNLLLIQCQPTTFTSPLSPLENPALSTTEVAIRQMLMTKTALTIADNLTAIAPRPALSPLATKSFKPTPANLPTIEPSPVEFPPLSGSKSLGEPLIPAGNGFIAHDGLPPYYNHGFEVENIWMEDAYSETLRTFVSAGYLSGPGGEITAQGLVDIRVLKPDGAFVYQTQVLTPIKAGSLHVVDAVGERLILKSTNGTTFYFDVPTRQFVSSLDAVAPTLTSNPPAMFPPMDQWNPTPMGAGFIVELPLPFNHGIYHIYSQWVVDRENRQQRVFVYTGELSALDGGSTNQGVVVVHVWQILVKDGVTQMNLDVQTELKTPAKVGALQIVNAVGERLILQSTNGTTFYFDVPTRQFVSSLEAVVPTFMPSPISPLSTPNSPIATPN